VSGGRPGWLPSVGRRQGWQGLRICVRGQVWCGGTPGQHGLWRWQSVTG
jgi:hypothetical protein